MKTIYKYNIEPCMEAIPIKTYAEAKVLSAGIDPNGVPSIWMEVETEAKSATYYFYCVGTGWDCGSIFANHKVEFVGTILDMPYIWHIFKDTKEDF